MSAVNLRFTQTQPASTTLRFGATDTPAATYHTATVLATAARVVHPVLTTRQSYFATMLASVAQSATADLKTNFDNAVTRAPHAWLGSPWEHGTKTPSNTAASHGSAQRREQSAAVGFLPGARRRFEMSAPWRLMSRRPNAITVPWQNAAPVHGRGVEAGFGALSRDARPSRDLCWSQAVSRPSYAGDAWITLLRTSRPKVSLPWGAGRLTEQTFYIGYEVAHRVHNSLSIPWEEAEVPPPGVSVFVVIPPPPAPCYTPNTALRFWELASTVSPDLRFRCPNPGGESTGETVVIPIQRAYIMVNDIALIRRENSLALPALALSINIDADSWTWGWQARLPAKYLDDVLPATPGAPVGFEAVINGVHWYLLAEKVQRDRSFPQGRIVIGGRGIAAELGAPYAAPVSRSNTGDRNAQQLMDDALMINGVGIGWTLDFGLTDWLVPAGAWSHTGSHIEAVARVAEAAGGYVQAHRTNKVLAIKPRYPVAPWAWNTVTPDFSIPAAFTTKEGVSWLENPDYNAVWISGEGAGVLASVTRQGTAGDLAAPMIVDALNTHSDAARQRGTAILGAAGRQQLMTLETPILSGVGIYPVGSFVQFADGANSRLGIVRSLAINAGQQVRQTIEVECHA